MQDSLSTSKKPSRSRHRELRGSLVAAKSYVHFELVDNLDSEAKTAVWVVLSIHGDQLGLIRWYGRWRGYTLWPAAHTVFSPGCLDDINAFIRRQIGARRAVSRMTTDVRSKVLVNPDWKPRKPGDSTVL
jgi:hypothetical protein